MILSLIILIFIAMGVIVGAKRGFTYQLIKMIGTILIIIIAYLFKDMFANFLADNFNFINLDKDISIIIYKFISFTLLFMILKFFLIILLKVSKGFEHILNATIILGIPSKILGGILGFIEYYIYTFIILLILCLPIFKIDINKSKVATYILKDTPVISNKLNVSLITDLKEIFNNTNIKESDYKEILEKYKIINKKD